MTPAGRERRGLLQRARGCLVMLAATLAAVAVLGFLVYQLRAPLLTRVGELLYYEDPLEPADAIVVLGGGRLDRVVEAADLFAAGYAPTVVLTRLLEASVIAELQARGLGVSTELELRLEYLEALGVPQDATTVLQRVVESTQAEAGADRRVDRVASDRSHHRRDLRLSLIARALRLRSGVTWSAHRGPHASQRHVGFYAGDLVAVTLGFP